MGHYIPEGYQHDRSYPCGESFIITDIHYNAEADLIAFGGCYWAGPSEVMVGDFSHPMHYDPHYFNVHYIIDPTYDDCCDVDFVGWEDGVLHCKGDGKPFSVAVEVIREGLRMGKHIG